MEYKACIELFKTVIFVLKVEVCRENFYFSLNTEKWDKSHYDT